ncbi:hypothetical protein G647_04446 [Cladophialophora carrionii CBS 160.54]|uniref:RBR-type E3 ubiquitin transferase n=1 Tax=Cladophialophora carrionii CBS 160.54 TaxID=1279043 RepID=V9DDZ9_9EURO|nr:uncharacterized protein G647_04446 [Cladophialophora carrionii CBS 160.54]ETI25075.1 hypothetical protein G647_04446 [Cladophialophora carrionii CBS 160.54]
MSYRSNVAPSSSGPPFQPVWEALRSSSVDLQPQLEWSGQRIPQELQRVVDDEADVPEKLRQILTWSLNLNAARPRTTPTFSAAGPTGSHNTTHNTTRDSNGIAADNAPESVFDRSSQPSEKRRPRPRNASNSVFASTIDLFASLIGKTTKDQPAAANSSKPLDKKHPMVECTSCFEDTAKDDTSKLPCTHSYCRPCLATLITTALENEASFPPKCCLTAIPPSTIMSVLDAKQRNTYREKAAEFSIPHQERWYCPNSKCLKWIRPSKVPRLPAWNERCPHCGTKICSICRGLAHKSSSECPQDSGLQATITLAELEGWRRCVRCRTMVERTQGCRHMTCKCGAQFCYTCGKKWRSCSCTETDEANRQAELRRRREGRESARDAEAAELARIIAQAEEMERRNPRERRREEQRREAERRRVEAELARLEAERLRELEALRAQEARLEQQLQRVLRLSVEESCRRLEQAWNETRVSQMHSLDSRHATSERQYLQGRDEAIIQQTRKHERTSQQMISNIEKRMSDIKERHTMEMTHFHAEQQNFEDDMFLEIQMHFRGKQDREARECRLQERFREQCWERHQRLHAKHELETHALRANAQMEMQALESAYNSNMAEIDLNFRTAMQDLSREVAADRAWFDFLSQRRQNMVAAHARLMLEALETGQDPVGLTEEEARTIAPFIGDVQPGRGVTVSEYLEALDGMRQGRSAGQPWMETLSPSPAGSASPTHSFVDLAATSRQLLKNLEADAAPVNVVGPPPSAAAAAFMPANELLLTNSAFGWMTGATPNDALQVNNTASSSRASGLRRSRWVSRHRPHPHPRTPASHSTATASSGCIMSSASQPCQFRSTPSSPGDHAPTVLPLDINKTRNPTALSEAPRRPQDDPTRTTPTVSVSAEATPPTHLSVKPTADEGQQDRVLGGLVPILPREEDRHLRWTNALTHRRQQSPSTGSASSSDSLVTTSRPCSTTTRRTTSSFSSFSPSSPPTSHRSSATSRSSGDSLFLHSLISAATDAATARTAATAAAARGAMVTGPPVFPSSPSALDRSKTRDGRRGESL